MIIGVTGNIMEDDIDAYIKAGADMVPTLTPTPTLILTLIMILILALTLTN